MSYLADLGNWPSVTPWHPTVVIGVCGVYSARFSKNDELLAEIYYDPDRVNELNEVPLPLVSPHVTLNSSLQSGYSALMWVCRWGSVEVAQVLLDYGADINAKNLVLPCSHSHKRVIFYIMRLPDSSTATHHSLKPARVVS